MTGRFIIEFLLDFCWKYLSSIHDWLMIDRIRDREQEQSKKMEKYDIL